MNLFWKWPKAMQHNSYKLLISPSNWIFNLMVWKQFLNFYIWNWQVQLLDCFRTQIYNYRTVKVTFSPYCSRAWQLIECVQILLWKFSDLIASILTCCILHCVIYFRCLSGSTRVCWNWLAGEDITWRYRHWTRQGVPAPLSGALRGVVIFIIHLIKSASLCT